MYVKPHLSEGGQRFALAAGRHLCPTVIHNLESSLMKFNTYPRLFSHNINGNSALSHLFNSPVATALVQRGAFM